MKHLGFLVACFLLPVSLLGGEISGGVRVDVAWNQEVDLRSYNGPNVEIAIRSREMQTVNYWIVDHENSVAVARTNINSVDVDRSGQATVWGTNRVEVKAPTKEHSIALGMSGLRVSDSNREAHLLYSHASGLKVYWFDVLDTKQNQCALLIVPAARPPSKLLCFLLPSRSRRSTGWRPQACFSRLRRELNDLLSRMVDEPRAAA